MQFFTLTITFFSLLSATGASRFPPETRQLMIPNTIIQDISNINNGVLANQASVSAFNGVNLATSLITGTPVLATVGAIHLANRKGFLDANLSGPINQADSSRIVDYVISTVGKTIPDAVDIIVGKKDAFVKSGQRVVVLSSLKLLLDDHDTFSAALLAKTFKGDPALNARADGVVAKIHDAIQGGINAYSS